MPAPSWGHPHIVSSAVSSGPGGVYQTSHGSQGSVIAPASLCPLLQFSPAQRSPGIPPCCSQGLGQKAERLCVFHTSLHQSLASWSQTHTAFTGICLEMLKWQFLPTVVFIAPRDIRGQGSAALVLGCGIGENSLEAEPLQGLESRPPSKRHAWSWQHALQGAASTWRCHLSAGFLEKLVSSSEVCGDVLH